MKNPGSAPDKKVEWSVLILFLLSDPAQGHILGSVLNVLNWKGVVRVSVHWGLLFSGKHLSFNYKLIWP